MRSLNPVYKKKAFKLSGSSSRLYLIMRSKFILSFLLLVLIPFMVIGAVMQVKGSISLIDLNNKQITNGFDNYIDGIESFFNLSLNNEDLLAILEKAPRSIGPDRADPFPGAAKILQDTDMNFQSLSVISAYLLRDSQVYTLYCKYNASVSIKNVFEKSWYQDAVKNPERIEFIGTSLQFYSQSWEEYVFSAAKVLVDPMTGKDMGLLLVDFDYATLASVINKSNNFGHKGDLYIINQGSPDKMNFSSGNAIMYCKSSSLLTSSLDEGILKALGRSSGTYLRNIDGKGYNIVSYNISPRTEWKVVYYIPIHKVLLDISFADNYWIIIATCLILVLSFSLVVYMVLLKPIARLTSVITEYEKGSFPTKINLDAQNSDTVVQPESQGGTSNIDNLINKVYYNQLKQKEAELNSLQNKINPHFLYNTLESIRGAALYHGIDGIASMAKALSLLFRYSINNNVLVTVREEIENLDNYITIQNFRHDDKFEVIYNIPEKVHDYKVLKLILQPIVENSIKHGLEMKLGKGVIKVTIWDVGSIFKIEISDDGIGMPPDKIIELNRQLSEGSSAASNENGPGSGTGIGIKNVNSRIKLYFGEQYGIKFREAQVGTTVEIVIPVVE